MSQQDRKKWDQRYAEDIYNKGNPVSLLENWIDRIPRGKALDIACGAGRNAIFMAQAGFDVDAIDISRQGLDLARESALGQGLDINWIEHDLDEPFLFDEDYHLIVVLWYVNLPLITRLCGCLAPGGYLLCEEHLVSDGDVIGPSNPAFRVKPGELRKALVELDIVYDRESIELNDQDERVASAAIVAKRKP